MKLVVVTAGILVTACGSSRATEPGGPSGGRIGSDGATAPIVFVIALENHDADEIYRSDEAPYLRSLLHKGARAENFVDVLPELDSEPHYVWMEAGTNEFPDHTFATDDDPSAENVTHSALHLVNQLEAAGYSWLSYQEDAQEPCPIERTGFYRPKHNPFVFFADVAGDPPTVDAARCAEHHRPASALAADLANDRVAAYNFITPNLCNDMHDAMGCPPGSAIARGDAWLHEQLPPLLAYAAQHDGAVFIVFDEPSSTAPLPFLALGPHVKRGYANHVEYSHSSLLKSLEELFAVPVLETVRDANDLTDLFE